MTTQPAISASAKVPAVQMWVCVGPGIAAFAIAAWVSLWLPPAASVHDDFGHLLIAETLLHGRISNPTPPSAESLQTIHQLVYPRYIAKFPFGTGATLALGYLLFGSYFAGMWLSAGFACSAITWMLLGHFKRQLAFLIGMLTALHPYLQTMWSQNYTHGWLAVGSISLVVGGLLRIRRRIVLAQRVDPGAWIPATAIAVGIVIGIFSRPFETVVVTSILGLPLLAKVVAYRWMLRPQWWKHAIPGLCVLSLGIGFQAYINHSVTGSAWKLPYQLHEDQYGVAPLFLWQKPREPSLGHRFLEQAKFHHGWSMDIYRASEHRWGYIDLFQKRAMHTYQHWGWFFACTPFALVILPRERRVFGVFLLAGVGGFCMINFVPWVATYYVASLLPIAILLAALILHRCSHWITRAGCFGVSRDRIGNLMLGAMLTFQGLGLFHATSAMARNPGLHEHPWAYQRQEMIQDLNTIPGQHLVMVRYHPKHNPLHEWVFNSSDPSRSKIVWARWSKELSPQVIPDYPDRTVWILEVRSIDSEKDAQQSNLSVGKDHIVLSRWETSETHP